MASPFLDAIRLVQALAAQGGFRVALIGGFALPFHGVRRATGDVDFLVDANGGDALHAGLVEAGHRSVHRSVEAANYRAGSGSGTAIDVLYARRPAALAMLARAPERATESGDPVRVVDVEGIVGLKLQAIANDPRRRRQDEADIVALLTEQLPSLDRALLAEYFRLFDREDALAEFLDEARRRRG